MKFKFKIKTIDITDWHDWFAWHPVRIGHTDTIAWLETVKRKCVEYSCDWGWEYKLKDRFFNGRE